MDISLTIKLNRVEETLVAPPAVQKRGKTIQVRSKTEGAKVMKCVLCSGTGKRGEESCRKCNGEGEFPSEYLLRISGEEEKDKKVFEEAISWAESRGLKTSTKLILKESLSMPKNWVLCGVDGGKFIPADKSGTIYAFRALLVYVNDRPTDTTAQGQIDLLEVRGRNSARLPLFTFCANIDKLDPAEDVKILPDAIRTSKFFPTEAVKAALKGLGWSSTR